MDTPLALVPLAAALACAAVILTLLRHPAWLPLDRPNERSLHPFWQGAAVLAVIWTTNLYNFMDGSDGLAGGMTLFGFVLDQGLRPSVVDLPRRGAGRLDSA